MNKEKFSSKEITNLNLLLSQMEAMTKFLIKQPRKSCMGVIKKVTPLPAQKKVIRLGVIKKIAKKNKSFKPLPFKEWRQKYGLS